MACAPCKRKAKELAEKRKAEGKKFNIIDAALETASGEVNNVSSEEFNRRLSICRNCDELLPVVEMCKVCKCLVNKKAEFAYAECDLGKWSK